MADGGGIRGISELIILQELMHRVRHARQLDHDPLPAEYFDLICGTSTGGYFSNIAEKYSVGLALTLG